MTGGCSEMRKAPAHILALILTVALCCGLISFAFASESTLNQAFFGGMLRLEARINSGEKNLSLFEKPDLSGKPFARLAPGDTISVLGAGNKSYRVSCNGQTGYVSKKKVTLTGIPSGNVPVSAAVISSSLNMDHLYIHPKDEDWILLTGSVELAAPVELVSFFIWDEWQQQVDRVAIWTPDSPVDRLDAADWSRLLKTADIPGGRKTLCIQAAAGDETLVVARLPFMLAGKIPDIPDINNRCVFKPNAAKALDASIETGWSPTEKYPELSISFPEDGSAAILQLEWLKVPEKTEITVTDADGQALLDQVLETGFWLDSITLPEGARTAVVRPYGKKVSLASVHVYSPDYPRDMVQQWEPMPENLDILLFSAHQDDEVLFFSGLVPWYSHLGKKIGIVYMADCGRNRYREAMRGMWYCGLRIHPVFLGFLDKEISSLDVATNIWPGSQEAIVRQIRRCKPSVVVCQDINGEYGHTQHVLTSLQVRRAVEYAADPSYDPDSAAEYGVWDVKKLYVHLYEENQLKMDWKIPLDECDGFTPWDIAVQAFEMHYSQNRSRYFRMSRQSVKWDSSLFGLYRTTVGPDTPGVNDMLENLD